MSRFVSLLPIAAGAVLLAACVHQSDSATTPPERGPDCSFRSATTCWTTAGRFPSPRPGARDSMPTRGLGQPPTMLAVSPDSVER